MKLLSQADLVYHQAALIKILQRCTPETEHYTFEFYKCSFSFVGDNGVFLRRCLRTLVAKNYLQFHKPFFNHQKWSITQKGLDYISDYDKLNPKPL